jgi:preprotein translocase subunit SecG
VEAPEKKYVVLAIYMFLIILFMYNIEKKNTPDYKAAEAKKKVI